MQLFMSEPTTCYYRNADFSLFFFTFLQKVLFNIEFCMMLDDGMMCWFLFLRFTMCLGLLSYHKWQTAFVVLSSWFFCSVEHMQFQSEKKLSRVQTLVPIQKGSGCGENSRQPGPIAGSHTCYNFIQYNFSLFLDIYFQYNFVVYELGLSWDILLDNSCVSRCRKDV